MTDATTKKPLEEGSELLNPWLDRWSSNRIGFHAQDVHGSLLKHGGTIIPNFSSNDVCSDPVRVFVPLCGKTVDMAYLAQHGSVKEVVGVEGIRKAFEEFAEEQPELQVKAVVADDDAYERFVGVKTTLLKGDFFGLDEHHIGAVDVVWDRASMVAISPSLRKDYVQVLHRLLKPGGSILLVTLDRRTGTPEGMAAGPPFSISEAQVRELYESQEWVESVTLLEEMDEFERKPDSKERHGKQGVTSFYELVFEIKTKK